MVKEEKKLRWGVERKVLRRIRRNICIFPGIEIEQTLRERDHREKGWALYQAEKREVG